MFPFLIGRIRTKSGLKREFYETMFPFLIGRIRTIICEAVKEYLERFPFLIGRIRTSNRNKRLLVTRK